MYQQPCMSRPRSTWLLVLRKTVSIVVAEFRLVSKQQEALHYRGWHTPQGAVHAVTDDRQMCLRFCLLTRRSLVAIASSADIANTSDSIAFLPCIAGTCMAIIVTPQANLSTSLQLLLVAYFC